MYRALLSYGLSHYRRVSECNSLLMAKRPKNEFFLFKDLDVNSLKETLKMPEPNIIILSMIAYVIYRLAWDEYFKTRVHPWVKKIIDAVVLIVLIVVPFAVLELVRQALL